ncbi:sugar transferase [Spirosoma soli]|uniref:Sugar transferase n=1 Tax=Spirosoma soli TaxID=1770529 RepID=A0ABW5M9Q4_9BACT
MDKIYFPPRKDNRNLDVKALETKNNQKKMEKYISSSAPSFSSASSTKVFLQWKEDENFLLKETKSFYLLLGKRIVDILISLTVIVFVLSWLFPIISLIILLDSRGPILFIQARTGYKGVTFPCLKFRTMYNVKQHEFKQTSFNDHRVTRVGRFLRRTNLDELPQFFNVLFGNMSIVGPRPHAVQHDAYHWASVPYRNRYCIKPGITGLAQIRGARGETDKSQKMEHRVRYDLFYVKRQSFGLDMAVFFWTISTMIKGDKNAW